MIIIGLMCLSFKDANKGCEALTYSFLQMLRDIYNKNDYELVCITSSDDLGKVPLFFPDIKFKYQILNIYSVKSWYDTFRAIKKMDVVFDGSYGDGFTGIYGTRRNGIQALRKQIVYWAGVPLFLLPQTYGKYKAPFKGWSKRLIRKAALAYARDDTAQLLPQCNIKTTSDMAFMLPYDKNLYGFDDKKKRFGINVSSLLWDFSTCKRFNLTINYRAFYIQLIDYLLNETNYEVHLIPHVIDKEHFDAPENDFRSCEEIAKMYSGKVIVAPAFETAIEAKSYISHMDIFMGSRMHSTIGAISSGVTTIPFSYAHKFESLYRKIGYNYIISATKLTTEDALAQIKEWVINPAPLTQAGLEAVIKAKNNVIEFQKDLKITLMKNQLL